MIHNKTMFETLSNKTMFCNDPSMVNSYGVWHNKNPLNASVPLLLVQLLLISVTSRAAQICLEPLGQSSIVAQILGGIVLGPSVLGRIPKFAETLFPQRGNVIIETLSTFGIVLFLFCLGVKMDARLMFRPDKIALIISLSLFFFTLVIPLAITIILVSQIDIETEFRRSLPVLIGSQSLVAFPAITCLLAELKIFNTEVGRLAVAISMFYDLLALCTTSCVFAYFETQQEGFLRTIGVLFSILGFIAVVVFVARIIILRLIAPEKDTAKEGGLASSSGGHVNDLHVMIVFVVLFISTLLSEIVGQHYYLGPIVFGLALPDTSQLGAAVVSKVDTFVSGLLYPTFLAISGLKTDVFSLGFPLSWKTAVIVSVGVVVKFGAVMLPAVHSNIPFPEAFVLGLVMNVRGITELIIYNLVFEDEKITGQDFTLLVISSTIVTALICPLVKLLYDPSKTYIAGRKMTIQHHRKDAEMTMVVCIHQQDNVPTLVNVLEASYASEQNPISVVAIVLVEVVGKSAPMLMAYKPQRNLELSSSSCGNQISNAFQQYERQNEGCALVQVFTNMAHFDAMHDDIRRVAAEKRANFIIVPFHKQWAIDGTVGFVNQRVRDMNLKLLEWSPCSLGILIDRGPANGSLSIYNSKSNYRVAVIFIGGADDTEALAYGMRMVKHEKVVVTVIRYVLLGRDNARERKYESEIIDSCRKSSSGNERFIYQEELVKDGANLAESIRHTDNNYDLILVGRSHQHTPLLFGLHEWSECPELGPLGDLLASSDSETTSSVLVVQQQKMVANTSTSVTIAQSTGNRDLFAQDDYCSERPSVDRVSVSSSPSVAISIERDYNR